MVFIIQRPKIPKNKNAVVQIDYITKIVLPLKLSYL